MFRFAKLSVAALAAALIAAPTLTFADTGKAASDTGKAASDTLVLTDSIQARATVTGINKKQRELTLRDESGDEFTVIAGDEVRNFAQIKKGDIIEVEYRRAAATRLGKASDANMAIDASTVERAPAGAKPGMQATQTTSIVAKILEIDPQGRLLTLQGPRGGIVTVQVPAGLAAFDSLKKGDSISAVYTEAVAVSVRSPAKK